MPVLEDILGSRINIAILRFLTAVHGGLSGNEIAKRLGLRQSSARQALERLVQAGVISRNDVGRSAVYALDRQLAFQSSVLVPLFDAELQQRRNVIRELVAGCRKLSPPPLAVILFGSLARAERSFRDIDLLCVVARASEKPALRDSVAQVFERLVRRYKIPISPIVVTSRQLRSPGLASLKREVRRDGMLLHGEVPSILKGIKV